MIRYLDAYDAKTCYGCRACEQICPKHAIHMSPNTEGFLYPVLDSPKCTACGLCAKACPYTNTTIASASEPRVYALRYQEHDALMKSSSGGAFSAIADYVLENGGCVGGCVFDEGFTPVHIIAHARDGAAPMRGSKYVQSDTRATYAEVKALLNAGKRVFYTGTPCQIAGLRGYLLRDYDKLVTADLICNGVPSPTLFRTYLDELGKSAGGRVVDFRFRNKERNGWASRGTVTFDCNGRKKAKVISPFDDSFYNLYRQGAISRMCCYVCQFATDKRVGDITIGDFWNIDDVLPSFPRDHGVSVVLVNTEKGAKLFEEISDRLEIAESDLKSVAAGNGNLRQPSDMPKSRAEIYVRVSRDGYDAAAKVYCRYSYIIPRLKRVTPRFVKRVIKSFFR